MTAQRIPLQVFVSNKILKSQILFFKSLAGIQGNELFFVIISVSWIIAFLAFTGRLKGLFYNPKLNLSIFHLIFNAIFFNSIWISSANIMNALNHYEHNPHFNRPEFRDELYQYMGGIIKGEEGIWTKYGQASFTFMRFYVGTRGWAQ